MPISIKAKPHHHDALFYVFMHAIAEPIWGQVLLFAIRETILLTREQWESPTKNKFVSLFSFQGFSVVKTPSK